MVLLWKLVALLSGRRELWYVLVVVEEEVAAGQEALDAMEANSVRES
jgi:hypothetical protein